jgi:predicted phage terminase large subunit-like protein
MIVFGEAHLRRILGKYAAYFNESRIHRSLDNMPHSIGRLSASASCLVRFGEKWKPSFWAEEHGQIISGVGPFLKRRAIERHAYTHREQFPSRGDKAVRAQSMRGRMAMLGLYVRQSAPWFADLRAELLSFPAGRHDDQVDALGLVGQLLDKINAGQKPKPPEVIQRDEYRAPFEEIPNDSFKTM